METGLTERNLDKENKHGQTKMCIKVVDNNFIQGIGTYTLANSDIHTGTFLKNKKHS